MSNCQYNKGYEDMFPDCTQPAYFTLVATCCGLVANGCLEHVNMFMDTAGTANGMLDHPACGAVMSAGFRIEPLDE